ncbi:MAG: T9SS type A sorting domain-containing protein [Ignavibacteriaceae bacterium]|nr:T9SS type A sorting domain-containing protein [Ignavibacteriaceae bacterium]
MIPDADNHPTFIFGPYPDNLQGTITGYKIYRSASHIPGQQPSNFTLLETLESDEYIYTDNTVTIGNDYSAKSYYTTCIYEDPWESAGETDPTNTVEVRLQIPQKIAVSEYPTDQKDEYQLNQNYPNPFNPTTIISYSLPASNHVTIKVFDILGNEVTTLLNEQKEAGTHTIVFNASDLSSGVYFYKIQAGNYAETRKLILQK